MRTMNKKKRNTCYFLATKNFGFSTIVKIPKEGASVEVARDKLRNSGWYVGDPDELVLRGEPWDEFVPWILHPEATSCSKCQNFSRQCLVGSIDDPRYCPNWLRKKIPNEDEIREIIREELSQFIEKGEENDN